MGTYFRRANQTITATTTRLLNITTGAAQAVFTSTGYSLMNIMNNGPANVSFGDASLSMGSGNVIFPYAQYIFENLSDDFSVFLRADSIATVVAVTEFKQ